MNRKARNRFENAIGWGILALFLAAVCGVSAGVHAILDHNCRARGGHLEMVWGGKGGWVCDGASR